MTNLSLMTRAALVVCVLAVTSSSAQTFSELVQFDGTNGANPASELLAQSPDGSFYGTTVYGGADDCPYQRTPGCGTVFVLTAAGALQTLHSFTHLDGANPVAGLILATDGNLYGTTQDGGSQKFGTVFRISPAGTLKTLHNFSSGSDGSSPYSPLIQATDGNFYGTTSHGGGNGGLNCAGGCGTIFRMTPAGVITILHAFSYSDGALVEAGLVQGTDGNFYGTTAGGGSLGGGTFFRISLNGAFRTLYNFDIGYYPSAGLTQANDGNLYGTTTDNGYPSGTIFRVSYEGNLTTIHVFQGSDGSQPYGGLTQASDGNLYGTTAFGGSHNYGTIFSITPAGTLTTLHSFSAGDGAQPLGTLLQASDGILYGTTYAGGPAKNGTVFHGFGQRGTIFSLDLGLGSHVDHGVQFGTGVSRK